jgi:histidine triad (HIT) family protein
MHMEDCIFCKIAAHTIPAEIVYEDADTISFLDIEPMNDGHTLVIPKAHAQDLLSIPEETWLRVTATVHKVAQAVEKVLSPDGINIVMNNRPAAGQVVFHAHVHIVPRKQGDGHLKAAYKKKLESDGATELGKQIRAELT